VEYHPAAGGKRHAKINFLLREKNGEANGGNHRVATQKLFPGQEYYTTRASVWEELIALTGDASFILRHKAVGFQRRFSIKLLKGEDFMTERKGVHYDTTTGEVYLIKHAQFPLVSYRSIL